MTEWLFEPVLVVSVCIFLLALQDNSALLFTASLAKEELDISSRQFMQLGIPTICLVFVKCLFM